MKKFILFSACLFLLSACNNDKPDAPEIQENPIFKVSMQDIQKAVRDALDNPINGMPNFDVPVIDAIDSIQADYRPAQSTLSENALVFCQVGQRAYGYGGRR